MKLVEKFTVLEDGESIVAFGTFDTYEQAVEHIREHAVKGHRYQVVKEFVTEERELPTIADTGWKGKYRGMWADVDGYKNPQLILGVNIDDDEILMLDSQYSGMALAELKQVHPRYDLAPVNFTPHPAYLDTLDDYEGAPTGTVIDWDGDETRPAYVKADAGEWTDVGRDSFETSAVLAGDRRKVLYWPEVRK